MENKLTEEALRVLGCLAEKELATPEYYPLSLNGLVSACNQKNNRDPVMEVEQVDVADALDELRQAGLALQAAESTRVPRYGHNLRGKLHLAEEQIAILCELLLRGPQTPGELRGRASRLCELPEVADVERVLQTLADRDPPLAVRLPVQAGHKEHRFAHLLGREPPAERPASPLPSSAAPRAWSGDGRVGSSGPVPIARSDEWRPRPAPPPPEPAVESAAGARPGAAEAATVAQVVAEVRLLRAEVAALADEVRALRRERG